MKLKTVIWKIAVGLCVVVALLLAGAVVWRDSERQYVEAANLAQRLAALRQSLSDPAQVGQKYLPSWVAAWKPVVIAMQFEAKHVAGDWKGIHLSQPLYDQLTGFASGKINDEGDLKRLLSSLQLTDPLLVPQAPLYFSEREQQESLATVAAFRSGISAVQSSEQAYTAWVSPILHQQQDLDRETTCKTLMEIKSFQIYQQRLQSKCATATKKWAACRGDDEPVNRQLKELQMTLESNLKKFQSRWSVENVSDVCAGL